MSEQQAAGACPHPEAVGTRWGDPLSEAVELPAVRIHENAGSCSRNGEQAPFEIVVYHVKVDLHGTPARDCQS
jgi:hypothetical protein